MTKRTEFHYQVTDKLNLTERAAECLHMFAEQSPGNFMPYNLLYKAIVGIRTMPNLKSSEVEVLRRKMSRVKQLLRQKYNRELVSVPGTGVRATTSDIDKLEKVIPKRVAIFERARERLVEVVDTVELKNVPSGHPMRKYLQGSVHPLLERINSKDFIKTTRAALPASTDVKLVPEPTTEKKAS